jgi:hypothetical protein
MNGSALLAIHRYNVVRRKVLKLMGHVAKACEQVHGGDDVVAAPCPLRGILAILLDLVREKCTVACPKWLCWRGTYRACEEKAK